VKSTTGDHLFKARSGFAQTKSADEVKLVAMQIIIAVYCVPKYGWIALVLLYVVMQFCSHSVVVVEQAGNPLARAQFLAQASANVIADVPVDPPATEAPPVEIAPPVVSEPPAAEAPPVSLVPPVAKTPPAVALAPPVAEAPPAIVVPPDAPPAVVVPPVAPLVAEALPAVVAPPVAEAPPAPVVPPVDVAPVLRPLPQDQAQKATPSTRTCDPTIFLDMQCLTRTQASESRRSAQEAP
jgi:hypothetical protein